MFLLFMILLCSIIFYFFNKIRHCKNNIPTEHLTTTAEQTNQTNQQTPLKVVNPKDIINILQDVNFKDTIFYTNDEDPYKFGNKLGLQKCFDNCNGVCVEFGVTGNAFCFK